MRAATELSATMTTALGEAMERGGKLIRLAGGFWTTPETPRRPHDGVPVWYVGASTVKALVTRERLAYTDWKEGRDFRFPVAASVISPTPTEEGERG